MEIRDGQELPQGNAGDSSAPSPERVCSQCGHVPGELSETLFSHDDREERERFWQTNHAHANEVIERKNRQLSEMAVQLEKAEGYKLAYDEIHAVYDDAVKLLPPRYLGLNWVHALVDMLKLKESQTLKERERDGFLLAQAQPHVCSLLCPSTRRGDEPWVHHNLCEALTERNEV